jgi:excisionase family DNA binding protein
MENDPVNELNSARPCGAPWSISEAAKHLGLCERTIRRLIENKRVRAIKFGRRLMIPDQEIKRISETGVA